jgi:pimeloyl-ACP methyl ester carboxylesterase
MFEVDVANIRVAFERRGHGPPLVLLHGAVSDSRWWRPQIEDLSRDFTVVAWDAPGCGRSSDPPDSYRLPDYADCLAVLIERLELGRPHVIGLSFGGGLAIEFHHRHPEVAKTLVLGSAYAGWAGSLSPDEVRKRLEKGLRDSRRPREEVVESWVSTVFSPSASPQVVEEAKAIMSGFHPVGMRVMLKAFAEADLSGALEQIDVPTLLLYGEEDVRSPLAVARRLHEAIGRSELVVIPEVGHATNLEAPETFNAEVRSFLQANERGRSG